MIYVKDSAEMIDPNIYSSGPLDRAAELREDEADLASRSASAEAVYLPVWRLRNYVAPDAPSLAGLSASAWAEHFDAPADGPQERVFLGLRGGIAYFTADISHIETPEDHPALKSLGRFEDLRQVGPLLNPVDASLLAYARGIVYWHSRHRHCGVCGAPTLVKSGGHRRKCTDEACAAEHFPRTDPAVIMLVHDGDRIIMGRAPRFPTGMHSVLAGFLEPGESLEDTVAREVREEVGIEVADIEYQSSQPWPFPASLMVGFRARALTFDLTPDPAELEGADWYSRDRLLASPDDDNFRLPRKDSIARRLIEAWLRE